MEDVMIRISVLWIFAAVAMVVHYAMLFFEPDVLQKMLSEEVTLATKRANARLAIVEAFADWLIPLTMAFLSVTLGGFGKSLSKYGFRRIVYCPKHIPRSKVPHSTHIQ
jgi:hypothetical protein